MLSRSIIVLGVCVLVMPGLASCGSLRGLSSADKVAERCGTSVEECKNGDELKVAPVNLDNFRLPSEPGSGTEVDGARAFSIAFYGAKGAKNQLGQVRARNYLQDEILRRSELMCAASKNKTYAADAGFGFAFLTFATVTAGAAAIVNGEEAVSILSALSSMAIGTNSILESEVFKDQLVTTLFAQIEAERKELRSDIEKRRSLATKDISKYTVSEAVLDAVRFHRKCDLISAMTGLSQTIRENENRGVIQKRYEKRLLEEELMRLTAELDNMTTGPNALTADKAGPLALQARINQIKLELGLMTPVSGEAIAEDLAAKEADGQPTEIVAPTQ